jgi:outer membrane lipoprotein-sorting protein
MAIVCYNAAMLQTRISTSIFLIPAFASLVGCSAIAESPESHSPVPIEEAAPKKADSEKTKIEKNEKANPKKKIASDTDLLQEISRKYRTDSGIDMKVKKKTEMAILKKTKTGDGQIFLSKGRLRMELSQPDKTILIFDRKQIWLVDYPPAEFGGEPQIGHIKVPKKSKDQALFSFLLGDEKIWNELTLLEKKENDTTLTATFKPKNTSRFSGLTELSISIEKEKKKILSLGYSDDIKNKTSFEFSDIKLGQKLKSDLFEYTPAAGANVTEY